MLALDRDEARIVQGSFALRQMNDVQACGGYDWSRIRLGKVCEGRKDVRVREKEFINIDVDDAVVPLEQTLAELPNGSCSAFIILRRAGNSEPIDLPESICRSVI
ncbi:hypothetical protein AA3271_1136 [Gluconobacter japonicus NBRC 3271]|nr:hypothetical protein AA3271_1136 [Gluconobacter japonicus NBRC 3271]